MVRAETVWKGDDIWSDPDPPRGSYEFNWRLLYPVTGEELALDLHPLDIE